MKDVEATTSEAALDVMSRHDDPDVRAAVATKGQVGFTTLHRLLDDDHPHVRLAAVTSPAAQHPHLHHASESDDNVLVSVAAARTNNPDTLHRLSKHDSPFIRGAVASNSSTSPADVITLLRDPTPMVRCQAAGNPQCPSEELRPFTVSTDVREREAAAGSPATSPDDLTQLVQDVDKNVRLAARRNTNAPEHLQLVARPMTAGWERDGASKDGRYQLDKVDGLWHVRHDPEATTASSGDAVATARKKRDAKRAAEQHAATRPSALPRPPHRSAPAGSYDETLKGYADM